MPKQPLLSCYHNLFLKINVVAQWTSVSRMTSSCAQLDSSRFSHFLICKFIYIIQLIRWVCFQELKFSRHLISQFFDHELTAIICFRGKWGLQKNQIVFIHASLILVEGRYFMWRVWIWLDELQGVARTKPCTATLPDKPQLYPIRRSQ